MFLAALGGVVITLAVWPVKPSIQPVSGGVYAGDIPVFGRVQLDLFAGEAKGGWIYREGEGAPDSISLERNKEGYHADVAKGSDWSITNATMQFRLSNSGDLLEGLLAVGTNAPDKPFLLRRELQHVALKRQSGITFGRFGANTAFYGQFPLLGTNSTFERALNRKITKLVDNEARGFTSGNLERHWDVLRDGDAVWQGSRRPKWQLRLLDDKLASFAIWDEPDDHGGANGNLTVWAGRTFSWQDGKIQELKLADFFRDDSGWDLGIRTFCRDALKRLQLESPARAVFYPDVDVSIFTLSPTGFQIYFNPYEIGSGGDGEFIIHIPYERLQKYYKSGWPTTLLPKATNR